jgi:putative sigma-54 modulation protein
MIHLTLTARHLELTEALRTYVEEKVRRIERYTMKPISAMVTLIVERYRHIVDISLNIHGTYVQAKVETHEMYGSIDRAVEKIERQMKKYKGKNQRKKGSLEDVVIQDPLERLGHNSSVGDALDFLSDDDAESSMSERNGTPKTTWVFGPIEPLC